MLKSFKYAINGIKDAIKSEPNFRFHLFAAVVVITATFLFRFSAIETAIIVIAISIVITLELINTIVEKLVDLYSKEISEKAREIKDMSAAVVFIGSIFAAIIGLIVLISKVL